MSPEEEVITSSPWMPYLLDFSKTIKYRISLWCIVGKVLQALYVHTRVDPGKGSSQLPGVSVRPNSGFSIPTNPENGRPTGVKNHSFEGSMR